MKTVTAKQIDEKFCCNDNAVVINVLPKDSFDKEHIPGSINIPLESKDFLDQIAKKVRSKTQDVAVYCANTQCTASDDAAKKLATAGYTSVYRFTGGMKEWKDTGHKVEGSGAGTAEMACGDKKGKGKGGCG